MNIAVITPIPYLEETSKASFHMVLGHLLNNQTYKNFYDNLRVKNPGTFILCDNSANEGYMIKGRELINLAASINADELIAPDKYHDAKVTEDETYRFLDDFYVSDLKDNYSVMAVPQGKTFDHYLHCFETFLRDPRINTIGIGYRNLVPAIVDEMNILDINEWDLGLSEDEIKKLTKKLEPDCFNYTMSRLFFLAKYVDFGAMKRYNKRIHLLGLYNPYELRLINKCLSKVKMKYIRSCDSASPWQAAQANVEFDKGFGVYTKPKAFLDFEQVIDEKQRVIFEGNLKMLRNWSGKRD